MCMCEWETERADVCAGAGGHAEGGRKARGRCEEATARRQAAETDNAGRAGVRIKKAEGEGAVGGGSGRVVWLAVEKRGSRPPINKILHAPTHMRTCLRLPSPRFGGSTGLVAPLQRTRDWAASGTANPARHDITARCAVHAMRPVCRAADSRLLPRGRLARAVRRLRSLRGGWVVVVVPPACVSQPPVSTAVHVGQGWRLGSAS
jgi:hypothetical protein